MHHLHGLIRLSIAIGVSFTAISHTQIALANTITLEVASGGTVTADVLASHESKTSPLGSFTETVSASGVTPDYLLSAMASQAVSFSSTTSSLLLSATGTATAQYVYLTLFDFLNNLVRPGASSSISLSFTIDDWASFDHHSSLTSFGNAFFGQVLAGSTEIPLNSCSGCGTSGLLAPGTYNYFIFAIAPGGNPDPVGGSALYATSFALAMVPEPSSMLLLGCGILLLIILSFIRKSSMQCRAIALLVCVLLTVLLTTPAMALPVIFTDRTAFNAAVSSTTLLTFDSPPAFECMKAPDGTIISCDFFTKTVDGLLQIGGDREALNALKPPGTLCSCNQTFPLAISTVHPVWAFGADVMPVPGGANVPIGIAGLSFQLSEPQFLGFLFSEPTVVGFSSLLYLNPDPSIGLGWSTFAIDNVAIKTVPEPSASLFMVLAVIGLIIWRWHDGRLNRRHLLSVILVVLSVAVPLLGEASQIAPNPNPIGSTINIVGDSSAFNDTAFVNAGVVNIDAASTLTNRVGASFSNGDLSYGVTVLNNDGTLTNYGSLGNGTGSTLTNSLGAALNNYGALSNTIYGVLTNAGTLNNYAGASVSLGGLIPEFTTNTGTINNFAGATFYIDEFGLTNSAGATFNNYGNAGGIAGIGNSGTFNNFGSYSYLYDQINAVGATLNNHGTIQGVFSLGNAGTLINSGSIQIQPGGISNAGTVINTGSISLGVLYSQSGGQTVNNGTVTMNPLGVGATIDGGVLRGTGTINGNVNIGSGALLAPGDATVLGKFSMHGSLQSSGDLLFHIQGLNVGQFDVLDISDTASFSGGTMRFSFSGFDPHIGNSWDFLYASAISGWDSLTFLFTGLDSTERAMFHFHDGIETLRIVAVPEPSSIFLVSAAMVGIAGWRRLSR